MRRIAQQLIATTCLTAVFQCGLVSFASANPLDGVVSAGQASITQAGKKLDIRQQTNKVVIDWREFNIAADEHTEFHQPDSSAIALNRVNSNNPSIINGKLTANGNVFLINQNGVLFGAASVVDVNGMVATTADISNAAFMQSNGVYHFDKPGNPDAFIVNQGVITAKDAGLVGLVAPNVVNEGLIVANLGRVHLASGDSMAVDMYGDGLLQVAVSNKVASQLVSNQGMLIADGGKVAMTAAAGKDIVNSLVYSSGLVRAQSVSEKNGEIIIAAYGSNAVEGNRAENKGQKAGESQVVVEGMLNASGRNKGERGGNILVTGDRVMLLSGSVVDASGDSGLSGTTDGKLVSDVRIGSAGGDIRIGGDYLGQGDTATALNLYVDEGALILNDALSSGDAGRSIFWSDNTTAFYGNVYARALGGKGVDADSWHAIAGGNAGSGGFVETSGHNSLDAGGYVDLTASNGDRGTYFLDPTDITIYGYFAPDYGTVIDGDSATLASALQAWFDASDRTSVTLEYGALGTTATGTSGDNTITVNSNAGLMVGARIRLGGAGATTAASTPGVDTYTITNIAGTTITLAENLSTNYNGGAGNNTMYLGYVSALADKSIAGNDLDQADLGKRPVWLANGFNGKETMYFKNADSLLNATPGANILNATAMTMGTVASASAASGNWKVPMTLWFRAAGGNGASSQKMHLSFGDGSGGPSTLFYQYGGGSYNKIQASAYYSSDTNAILNAWMGASGGGVGLNGDIKTSAGVALDTNTDSALMLGDARGGFFVGNISESYVYNRTNGANTQVLLDQYQSAKWSVELTPPGSGATEVDKATASIYSKGDGADGYSVFTTRYLERLSESANVSLAASNNITFDLQTDVLNFATAGRSLTLTAGNQITTASAGGITTNGGDVIMNASNGIALNHAIDFNTNGGALTFNNNVTLGANQNWNAGAGTTSFAGTLNGTVAHTQALTAAAGAFSFGGAVGGGTQLGALALTSIGSVSLPSISADTISVQTTGATADLTLAGGSTLTANASSGNSIVLAAGRNFINSAGGSALSTTGTARWLVYTASPGATTLGGLSPDFTRFSSSYAGYAPGSVTENGNGLLYSEAGGILRFTADSQSRLYGQANPLFTYSFFCSTGCTEAASVTGTPTLSSTAGAGSNVASYTITTALGSLSLTGAFANCAIELVDGALAVDKAILTATADPKSMTYGGVNPTLTATLSGYVNGEDATSAGVTGSAALSTTASTSGDGSYNAGSWTITAAANDLSAANYDFQYVNGTLTVAKAGLSVTADDNGITAGDADPAFTYSYNGLVNGDTTASFSGALGRAAGSAAGTYSILQNTLLATGNYTISSYTPGTFTITAAPGSGGGGSGRVPPTVARVSQTPLLNVAQAGSSRGSVALSTDLYQLNRSAADSVRQLADLSLRPSVLLNIAPSLAAAMQIQERHLKF